MKRRFIFVKGRFGFGGFARLCADNLNGCGQFFKKIGKMFCCFAERLYLCTRKKITVFVVQLVRISDCGPEGRGFKSHRTPNALQGFTFQKVKPFFCAYANFVLLCSFFLRRF